jgi:hypothetical protein
MGSLASIQACLTAGIYLLPSDERNTAYVYLGIALRMAIASRMHRNTHIVEGELDVASFFY